jgi:hypothetical protein
MEARATFHERRMSARALGGFIGLAFMFLLGSAGGYAVKAFTTPSNVVTHVVTVPPATPKQTILPNQT